MTRRLTYHERGYDWGERWMAGAALRGEPQNLEGVVEYFQVMARRFGMFALPLHSARRRDESLPRQIEADLTALQAQGFVTRDGDWFALTPGGRERIDQMMRDLERGGAFISRVTRPAAVSTATLIVHLVLGAVKLPAALLSGSVGLLNDALDTLLDAFSSLVVFFGIRSGRERLASVVLLVFMSGTGLYALAESVLSFFRPTELEPDLLAFAAVALSGVVCAGLWLYQRFVGLRHSCLPLIAQSVDSRNHIIVAGGVAVGLVAGLLSVPVLDRIVGVVVALLIIKGAVELLVELLRSRNGEPVDLSRYGFRIITRHRNRQLVRWLLYEVRRGEITSAPELRSAALAATDFRAHSALTALGLAEQPNREELVERAVNAVLDEQLADGEPLRLTPAGERELQAGGRVPGRGHRRRG